MKKTKFLLMIQIYCPFLLLGWPSSEFPRSNIVWETKTSLSGKSKLNLISPTKNFLIFITIFGSKKQWLSEMIRWKDAFASIFVAKNAYYLIKIEISIIPCMQKIIELFVISV